MPTETAPTSLQTGVTSSPISQNTQDFSVSDDEIMDNFADGPNPNDDGMPLGLGGEKGRQSEPASSTLEADIVQGTKQPGTSRREVPERSAGESKPDLAGETGPEEIPESEEEPETPEFPPMLLQMAGLSDASAAHAAGFDTPAALFAAVKWRGQMLKPESPQSPPSERELYRRQQPVVPSPPTKTAPEPTGEAKPFQLPQEKLEMFDEDLQVVLREMNQHYQQEMAALRSSVSNRDKDLALQQAQDEEAAFDKAVQGLGKEWQDVFGDGSGITLAELGQRDPVAMTNFHHRKMLFDAVQAVRDVNAKQGYKPMSLEQEMQWALMQRYPDKFQETISGKSSSRSASRPGVTASRPTQRKTPSKSQNAKLLSDVNAMLKKRHGYTIDLEHREDLDGDI